MAEAMSEDNANQTSLFVENDELEEFLSALGVDGVQAEDARQEDGSIILAIGDRAVTIEAQPSINGVVISAFIARVPGPEITTILHELMILNARPHATGGLVFGLIAEEIIVGSLIVAQPYVSPHAIAEAVHAVIESTDIWRDLIESGGQAIREVADAEISAGDPNIFV